MSPLQQIFLPAKLLQNPPKSSRFAPWSSRAGRLLARFLLLDACAPNPNPSCRRSPFQNLGTPATGRGMGSPGACRCWLRPGYPPARKCAAWAQPAVTGPRSSAKAGAGTDTAHGSKPRKEQEALKRVAVPGKEPGKECTSLKTEPSLHSRSSSGAGRHLGRQGSRHPRGPHSPQGLLPVAFRRVSASGCSILVRTVALRAINGILTMDILPDTRYVILLDVRDPWRGCLPGRTGGGACGTPGGLELHDSCEPVAAMIRGMLSSSVSAERSDEISTSCRHAGKSCFPFHPAHQPVRNHGLRAHP